MLSLDIHSRTTRIVRRSRVSLDDRRTLVFTGNAEDACRSCRSSLAEDAQFCGMCGERIRPRTTLSGTIVDQLYAVEERIAEGRTSAVYRARYLPNGREVALKVLHDELAANPIAAERFRREGKCLARLRDAHTIAVYDHGEAPDGTLYIAMELLHGEGLDVRVRTRGPMPWRPVLEIVRAVCTSLAEAHSHGIVHRNLEASNIRLEAGDAVKVIDFGLAKLRPEETDEELTYGGQAVGTLAYMAPEQLCGGTCDARADLYALGVIALEAIRGRARTHGAPSSATLGDLPQAVEGLLRRCTASDPAERPASAVELGAEIDRILAPAAAAPRHRRVFAHTSAFELQPPRIVLDIASEPERPVSRRSRWRTWAILLAACSIGLGTAVAGCV